MYQSTRSKVVAATVGVILGLSDAGILEADSSRGGASRPTVSRTGSPSDSQPLTRSGRSITPPKGGKKSQRGSSSILRTIGALLFIVTLIVVGARVLRKHTPRLNGGIPPEAMEVLGKRAIDQRQVVHLVRLGSRILVIGGSPQGLQTLAEITDPIEVDYLAGMCRRDESESRFTQGFLALFRRQPATDPADGAAHESYESPDADSHEGSAHTGSASPDLAAAHSHRLGDTDLNSAEVRHA